MVYKTYFQTLVVIGLVGLMMLPVSTRLVNGSLTIQPKIVSADDDCDPGQNKVGCITNPVKDISNASGLFAKIMSILFSLIAVASVIMIMAGGFQLIAGSGNPSQRTKAKDRILWAVVGLIIALMSFSIVAIVQSLTR